MQDRLLDLALEVSRVTEEKVGVIDQVMRQTGLLAINARLGAARAGTSGDAFVVNDPTRGCYRTGDTLVAYALTPGYETYRGLGWYGCVEAPLRR